MNTTGIEGQMMPLLFINSANCMDAGITICATSITPAIETNPYFSLPVKLASVLALSVMAWHVPSLRKVVYILAGILFIVFAWNMYAMTLW